MEAERPLSREVTPADAGLTVMVPREAAPMALTSSPREAGAANCSSLTRLCGLSKHHGVGLMEPRGFPISLILCRKVERPRARAADRRSPRRQADRARMAS
jgi:hypothetical protein